MIATWIAVLLAAQSVSGAANSSPRQREALLFAPAVPPAAAAKAIH